MQIRPKHRQAAPPLSIASARIELRWFFQEAEGALGLKGIDYNRGGGRQEGADAARSYESAVARDAEVRRRLAALPEGLERVLRLAFGPFDWGRHEPGLRSWYELAGVAALMVDPDDVVAAGRTIVGLKAEKAEALRLGAAARLRLALGAYAAPVRASSRGIPMPAGELDHVPMRDASRTWVPQAEERGWWMSPGEQAQGHRYGEEPTTTSEDDDT